MPNLIHDLRDPSYLLNLFGWLAALSVATILLLAGYGVYRVYSGEMIQEAEEDAAAIGQTIFEYERGVLLGPGVDGRGRVALAAVDLAGLDERMRKYLRPFHIFKIKVFSRDKTVVYSTDHSIIGKTDSGNSKLDRVLGRGDTISNLESKDRVLDLAGEQRFEVDVVETYLPIRTGDAIVGSFEVYVDVTRTRERIAKAVALSVVVLLAVLIAVFTGLYALMRKEALLLKEAQDKLREMANVDILTGLFNRRHLMARAHEEYSRIYRGVKRSETKGCVGFVMADLDHFKLINDAHGHLVGDEVLRAVSARLKSVTRDYDVVGRYGGEEFLIVLPSSNLEDAKLVAERMRRIVESSPIAAGARSFELTVSLGAACTGTGDPDEFAAIGRADKALYEAKRAGRNRVVWL